MQIYFRYPVGGDFFDTIYLETMARMRRIIGCFDNGAAEFVTRGVNGLLIPAHDIEAFAITQEALVSSTDTCCAMGRKVETLQKVIRWGHNAYKLLAAIGLEPEAVH